MTAEEFDEWAEYHGALHPNWRNTYVRMNAKQLEIAKREMYGRLRSTTLGDAKLASRRLLEADRQTPASRHVIEIARIAQDLSSRRATVQCNRAAGSPTYRCVTCRDTGKVLVYAGCCTWPSGELDTDGQAITVRERYRRQYATASADPTLGLRMKLSIPCYCDLGLNRPDLRSRYDELVLGWKDWPPPTATPKDHRLYLSLSEQEAVLLGRRKPNLDMANLEF